MSVILRPHFPDQSCSACLAAGVPCPRCLLSAVPPLHALVEIAAGVDRMTGATVSIVTKLQDLHNLRRDP